MFSEKNQFFQRVGWCSVQETTSTGIGGGNRNLLQESAEPVANPDLTTDLRQETRCPYFVLGAFKLLERTPAFAGAVQT